MSSRTTSLLLAVSVLAISVLVATLASAAAASGATPGSEGLGLPLQAQATVIQRGTPNRQVVSLTFDAGADRGFGAHILDVLRAEGVRASFGPTGQWARQNPDLIRRIVTEGHTLFNHTQTHRSWTGLSDRLGGLSAEQRLAELRGAEQDLAAVGGGNLGPVFRPPYGDYDTASLSLLGSAGYSSLVLWTVDSGGWRGWSASTITRTCLQGAVPGAIYVLHVGAASQDAVALPEIIRGLRTRGYSFETLPEILR